MAERVASTTTLGGGREGLRALLRTQTSERRQNEWYRQPPGPGRGARNPTPNAPLVFALPSARSSPLQRAQKRFALGRGVNVLGTVTLLTSNRRSRMPLAEPDSLMVTYESLC